MKIIHALAIAAGMTTLAACGGNEAEDNAATTIEANTLVVDNLTDMNMDMNMDMNVDSNMDMNATTNAADTANTTNTY